MRRLEGVAAKDGAKNLAARAGERDSCGLVPQSIVGGYPVERTQQVTRGIRDRHRWISPPASLAALDCQERSTARLAPQQVRTTGFSQQVGYHGFRLSLTNDLREPFGHRKVLETDAQPSVGSLWRAVLLAKGAIGILESLKYALNEAVGIMRGNRAFTRQARDVQTDKETLENLRIRINPKTIGRGHELVCTERPVERVQ